MVPSQWSVLKSVDSDIKISYEFRKNNKLSSYMSELIQKSKRLISRRILPTPQFVLPMNWIRSIDK